MNFIQPKWNKRCQIYAFLSSLVWPVIEQSPLCPCGVWICVFNPSVFHFTVFITVTPPTDMSEVPQMTSYSYLTPSGGT